MTKPLKFKPWKPTTVSLDFIGTVITREPNVCLGCRFSWDGCDEYDAFRSVKAARAWVGEGRDGLTWERSEVDKSIWFVYAKVREERDGD